MYRPPLQDMVLEEFHPQLPEEFPEEEESRCSRASVACRHRGCQRHWAHPRGGPVGEDVGQEFLPQAPPLDLHLLQLCLRRRRPSVGLGLCSPPQWACPGS